mmetsp:Transcript_954/g.2263  ORF Transcript_954/g.2263 Transcript_954/m.2263 type:complete len:310 (-) Transcript_954:193-1122(-)
MGGAASSPSALRRGHGRGEAAPQVRAALPVIGECLPLGPGHADERADTGTEQPPPQESRAGGFVRRRGGEVVRAVDLHGHVAAAEPHHEVHRETPVGCRPLRIERQTHRPQRAAHAVLQERLLGPRCGVEPMLPAAAPKRLRHEGGGRDALAELHGECTLEERTEALRQEGPALPLGEQRAEGRRVKPVDHCERGQDVDCLPGLEPRGPRKAVIPDSRYEPFARALAASGERQGQQRQPLCGEALQPAGPDLVGNRPEQLLVAVSHSRKRPGQVAQLLFCEVCQPVNSFRPDADKQFRFQVPQCGKRPC